MLFPTAYFPSIAYVQAMCKWGEVTLDCHEHWVKQSIRNRCAILNAAGRQNLIIPIIHGATKTPVGQIQVDDTKKWRSHHWKSIHTAYGKSPYFEYYEHLRVIQLPTVRIKDYSATTPIGSIITEHIN